jgi:hypothetical protein
MKRKGDESRFDELARLRQSRSGPPAESGPVTDQPPPSLAPDEKVVKFRNPAYIQTTVYLLRTQHKRLKKALIDDEEEFSDLIERLLEQWLQSRKS